jgi:hypothetical protein
LRAPYLSSTFEIVDAGFMPRVHKLSNSNVYVHARNEHPPPHFHVYGPGWEVVIFIRSLTIMDGHAPKADLLEVLHWAATNKDFLIEKWEEFNERD